MSCSVRISTLEAVTSTLDCEEATLIRLARAHTALGLSAREQLIKRYDKWITRRCLQILANEAQALDVAQDVKLNMFRALKKFEGRSTLRTWLNRIIQNQCVSQQRKSRRIAINAETKALITIYEQDQRNVESESELPMEAIKQALKALPVKAREVLQLRFYKDLALAEISQVLGISLSSTKMRLYRAMEQFKLVFQRFNNDTGFLLINSSAKQLRLA